MAVAGYNSSVLVASLPSVALTDDAMSTSDNITWTTAVAAHRYLDKSVAAVVQEGLGEIQQITITGSPTGGTFTLTQGGQTTAPINWNDTAATVQAALQALSSIGSGNIFVTGGPGPGTPFVAQWGGTQAPGSHTLIALATNSLTGGVSPSVSITRLQGGQAFGTLIDTNFTLFRANARIVFPTALGAGKYFRLHSGNYFPYALIAEAANCDFAGKMGMEDSTTFQSAAASNGAHSFTPTTLNGTLKYHAFWANNARLASLQARDFLIVSFQLPTGNRYEGFCYASDCNIKDDVNKLVTQDLIFQLTDEFFNA